MSETSEKYLNFIEQIIEDDLKSGKHKEIHTRFPPEPNGFLHIGHSKAICTSFGLAKKYGGKTNLRFDDTNPVKEDTLYVEAIRKDIKWLGFEWDEEHFTSNYFEQLYQFAVELIKKDKAYVDDQSAELIAQQKGTPTEAGTNAPARSRSVEENLDLFARMRAGEFKDGELVLRAKIDMAHPNMHMRDPLIYRIKHAHHHNTGDAWCIYPMYDFAHGQSDSIEEITHSLCSLEFEVHRPLYNWFIEQLGIYHSRQIEFARLNLSSTVMSKRRLLRLVEEGVVDGWDDPRMPTIAGLRRRGYTPESIIDFNERVGLAKRNNVIDVSLLEFAIRNHLNKIAPRVMAVLRPLKVLITNYPEGKSEELETINNPEDESMGSRILPFGREIYIEQDDFMEDAPKKYFRLAPGKAVRLKSAYIIEYEKHLKDAEGNVTEVHVKYYENSKSGEDTSGIKAKGVLHWVSCEHAFDAEVRLYDRLFSDPAPDGHKDKDFMEFINPDSLEVLTNCKLEPSLKDAKEGDRFQFQRMGYFCVDSKYSKEGAPVFNRTVTLKDTWAKLTAK
ncbi:MAG: glutamine--tRNA ligase/YqeY domain fusion protein [Flavobacteriales bacterium]|nr:glutamine--tRNA ligase/YqeY domain fusion protein [Flavobacteriales bacterium]MDG1765635.1 glutamine--tRNA ligase/YqeY domain fusion protein [Flavobacteriales bacterium]